MDFMAKIVVKVRKTLERRFKITKNSFTIILVHGYTNNPSDFDLWVEYFEQEEL